MKVHYADKPRTWGVSFPLCWNLKAFDSPATRRRVKVTCKDCLRLLKGAK